MTYSRAYQTYIPFMFILLQSKKSLTYWHALNQAIASSDFQLRTDSVTSDFEPALLEQVSKQFTSSQKEGETFLIFCYFHWKQCLRRKLKELHFSKDIISKFMVLVSLLTIIPIEEIATKGISYVRSKTAENIEEKVQWETFWTYFRKTWLRKYNPRLWNVSYLIDHEDRDRFLINRTNNPLERYNRRIAEKFREDGCRGKPTMDRFISVLKGESSYYLQLIDDIKMRKISPTFHKDPTLPEIPADYENCFLDREKTSSL